MPVLRYVPQDPTDVVLQARESAAREALAAASARLEEAERTRAIAEGALAQERAGRAALERKLLELAAAKATPQPAAAVPAGWNMDVSYDAADKMSRVVLTPRQEQGRKQSTEGR